MGRMNNDTTHLGEGPLGQAGRATWAQHEEGLQGAWCPSDPRTGRGSVRLPPPSARLPARSLAGLAQSHPPPTSLSGEGSVPREPSGPQDRAATGARPLGPHRGATPAAPWAWRRTRDEGETGPRARPSASQLREQPSARTRRLLRVPPRGPNKQSLPRRRDNGSPGLTQVERRAWRLSRHGDAPR